MIEITGKKCHEAFIKINSTEDNEDNSVIKILDNIFTAVYLMRRPIIKIEKFYSNKIIMVRNNINCNLNNKEKICIFNDRIMNLIEYENEIYLLIKCIPITTVDMFNFYKIYKLEISEEELNKLKMIVTI